MCTHHQNYLDAIETVLAWELPDEVFIDAINDQFRLMAGFDPDESWERYPDNLRYFHS